MRWIYFLPILFSTSVFAQDYDFLVKFNLRFENKKIVENGVFAKPASHFDDLLRDQAQFKNYDQFVDYIFSHNPTFADNYVLVHHSESQQPGSFEFPRTIIFEGGTAYAFSDLPDQKEKRVEIMQVEPGSYKVSLHEIVFNDEGVHFNKNAKSCVACHGNPAKPLWNPYDFWPNAFGSAVGFFGTAQERAAYARLPFSTQQVLKHLKAPQTADAPTMQIDGFTQYIHQINIGRWIKEQLTPEHFNQEAALPLMGVLSYCTKAPAVDGYPAQEFLDFFAEDDRSNVTSQYPAILADVKAARKRFKGYLDNVASEIFPQGDTAFKIDHSRLENEVYPAAQMQYVLTNAGIDTHNLTTSLYANDYLISAPLNAPLDFLATLYEVRPDLFAGIDFKNIDIGTGRMAWIQLDCKSLAEKSRNVQVPEKASTWTSFTTVNRQQPVMSRCAKCHVDNVADSTMQAPKLPFNNPLEFARRINDPKDLLGVRIMKRVRMTGAGQMPPAQALLPDEITALEEFIGVLKSPSVTAALASSLH